jgi:hypothetical protein
MGKSKYSGHYTPNILGAKTYEALQTNLFGIIERYSVIIKKGLENTGHEIAIKKIDAVED